MSGERGFDPLRMVGGATVAVVLGYLAVVGLEIPISTEKEVTAVVTSVGPTQQAGSPNVYPTFADAYAEVRAEGGRPIRRSKPWQVRFNGEHCTRKPPPDAKSKILEWDTSHTVTTGQQIEATCHRYIFGPVHRPSVEWYCEWWCYGIDQ